MSDEKPDLLIVSDLNETLQDGYELNHKLAEVYHQASEEYKVVNMLYTSNRSDNYKEVLLRKIFMRAMLVPASMDTRVVFHDGIYDLASTNKELVDLADAGAFPKDHTSSFKKIGEFWHMNLNQMLFVDDLPSNRDVAEKAGCMVSDPNPQNVMNMVQRHSQKRLKVA